MKNRQRNKQAASGRRSTSAESKRPSIAIPTSEEPEYSRILREGKFVDPLSEVTRKERKNLLLVSFVSLAVTLGNLVPQEVTALGIKVSQAEQRNLFLLLACAILYLMCAFIFYGYAEFQRWQADLGAVLRLRRAAGEEIRKSLEQKDEPTVKADATGLAPGNIDKLMVAAQAVDDLKQSDKFIQAARRRLWFEYSVPLLAGVWALILLLQDSTGIDLLRGPSAFAVSHPVAASITGTLILVACALFFWRKDLGSLKRRLRRIREKWEHKRFMKLSEKVKKFPEGSKEQEEAKAAVRAEFQKRLDRLAKRTGLPASRTPVVDKIDVVAEPSGSSGQAPPAR